MCAGAVLVRCVRECIFLGRNDVYLGYVQVDVDVSAADHGFAWLNDRIL